MKRKLYLMKLEGVNIMDNKINLKDLNDIQKVWLSDLAYVDITEEGYKKMFKEGITIFELREYAKNPSLPVCGDLLIGTKNFNFIVGKVLKNDSFPSKLDIVNTLIENGLGSIKIVHGSDYPTIYRSGFQALTFEDSFGNVGISFKGSDIVASSSTVREWLQSNILEYFVDDSPQAREAVKYFLEHKTDDKDNYIYGHSLGGNLVSHVYLNCYKDIKQAFSINGTPINQKLINTEEKIKAFNDKEKFSFNIVCGDVIGQLKSCEVYKKNVNYIKNNNKMIQSFLSAHMIQASAFDENGNFIKISEGQMLDEINFASIRMINISRFTREKMNNFNFRLSKKTKYKAIIKDEQLDYNSHKTK